MTSPANLENSKTLYELSGWDGTQDWHWHTPLLTAVGKENVWTTGWTIIDHKPLNLKKNGELIPAYTSDYLLDKLPAYIATYGENGDDCLLQLRPNFHGDVWTAGYTTEDRYLHMADADTPADALALLAIRLLETGVLPNESQASKRASTEENSQ